MRLLRQCRERSRARAEWSEEELRESVRAYLEMVRLHRAGMSLGPSDNSRHLWQSVPKGMTNPLAHGRLRDARAVLHRSRGHDSVSPKAGRLPMDRIAIADMMCDRLEQSRAQALRTFNSSNPKIGHFYVDDLLPDELCLRIFSAFPAAQTMQLKKSLREYKYIAAQMDNYDPSYKRSPA
jgi:hypothetical protein